MPSCTNRAAPAWVYKPKAGGEGASQCQPADAEVAPASAAGRRLQWLDTSRLRSRSWRGCCTPPSRTAAGTWTGEHPAASDCAAAPAPAGTSRVINWQHQTLHLPRAGRGCRAQRPRLRAAGSRASSCSCAWRRQRTPRAAAAQQLQRRRRGCRLRWLRCGRLLLRSGRCGSARPADAVLHVPFVHIIQGHHKAGGVCIALFARSPVAGR